MSGKINFGIIGCGRIASRHAGHIQRLGKLVAVCDNKPDKAEKLATDASCAWYTSHEELFKKHPEIDVIAVCTPNGLHAEHTIAALESGFHVLCEKPMAISVPDCNAMIKTAEKANKELFIVKQNRFNPAVIAMKKSMEEGRLGKIMSMQLNCFWNRNFNYYQSSDWKGTKDLDGGTLYTQFSHFIDLLYWIIGDVSDVKVFTHNYAHNGVIDFEDTGVIALKFNNGVIGTINYTVNSFGRNMEGSITLFGEKGTIKVGGQYLNELEYQRFDNYEIGELAPGNPANEYGEYQGSMSNHDKVYENVIRVLTGKEKIATSGFEGMKTVEIIEKIYREANA